MPDLTNLQDNDLLISFFNCSKTVKNLEEELDEVLRDNEILFRKKVKAVRKRENLKRVGVKNKDRWVITERNGVCEKRKQCLEGWLTVERRAVLRSQAGVGDAEVPTVSYGAES